MYEKVTKQHWYQSLCVTWSNQLFYMEAKNGRAFLMPLSQHHKLIILWSQDNKTHFHINSPHYLEKAKGPISWDEEIIYDEKTISDQ